MLVSCADRIVSCADRFLFDCGWPTHNQKEKKRSGRETIPLCVESVAHDLNYLATTMTKKAKNKRN